MRMTTRRRVPAVLGSLLTLALLAPSLAADDGDSERGLSYGFEVKGHYRDSDEARFPVNLPPQFIPPGTVAEVSTVEPGEHTEISNIALWLKADWGTRWSAKIKVDLIDLHDRNPTSEDREVDLDEVWIRWGEEVGTAELAEGPGLYVLLGKIPKFERQDDRHLESYGLLGTTFNRFEDVGVELGFDLGRHLYIKTSLTQGNPLFLRDPNALAGDNGVQRSDGSPELFPDNDRGIPIFYDADVDVIDFENPEVGLALGARLGDAREGLGAEIMLWGFDRELAEEARLSNTLYGGDLDLLRGPLNLLSLDVTDDGKQELGANLWLYWGNFSLFAQVVDQELAGLSRTGFEVEAAWAFDLPYWGAAWGRQVFSYIAPAVRYSELDPDFTGNPQFPAPSARWDWEKIDLGLRLGLIDGLLDLTVEWNLNDFVRAGVTEEADEFLATVRWQMDGRRGG